MSCDDVRLFSMSGNAGAAACLLSGPTSLAFVSGIFPSLGDDGGLDPLPEFAEAVDPEYLCSSCDEVLRQPKQTPCGHRICTACLERIGPGPFRCPADEDGCLEMTIDEVSLIL